MAGQLLIHPRVGQGYDDGDVLLAPNSRQIRSVHAQHICWSRRNGRKVGGMLGGTHPLLELLFQRTRQYKFERVSWSEVRRTDQWTLAQDTIGPTPNTAGEYIKVDQHVSLLKAAGKQPLFGDEGAEIWYGGKTRYDGGALDIVWVEIESRTPHREAEYRDWPVTSAEKKEFLPIETDDFDDATAKELVSPLRHTEPVEILTVEEQVIREPGNKAVRQEARITVDRDVAAFTKIEKLSIGESDFDIVEVGNRAYRAIPLRQGDEITAGEAVIVGVVKKRKHFAAWRNLPGVAVSEEDVLNTDIEVDLRPLGAFVRSKIIATKAV
jgi:hypothetical protein